MRRPALAFAATCVVLSAAPAAAMVGNAYVVPDAASRPEVMLVGSRGNFCTGVAIARDLVLTAAHCVQAGAEYKQVELDADRKPVLKDVLRIARHPQFNLKTMLAHRATADVALVKLAKPLNVAPAPLMVARSRVPVGERFAVYGYGMAVRTDANTSATLRAATLIATGQPGNLQLRLVDPATGGKRGGLGACTGDSGAPVFQDAGGTFAVMGVVSWSTGPNGEDGCGGLTGVTPLELYRNWIVETAARLGSPLEPRP
jgi:secreted trypsin-like serine protease